MKACEPPLRTELVLTDDQREDDVITVFKGKAQFRDGEKSFIPWSHLEHSPCSQVPVMLLSNPKKEQHMTTLMVPKPCLHSEMHQST